jgi:hypothetical protein
MKSLPSREPEVLPLEDEVPVLVRHTFEMVEMHERKYATKNHIEFLYNESSSCSSNILERITKVMGILDEKNECLCHAHRSEVLEIDGVKQ